MAEPRSETPRERWSIMTHDGPWTCSVSLEPAGKVRLYGRPVSCDAPPMRCTCLFLSVGLFLGCAPHTDSGADLGVPDGGNGDGALVGLQIEPSALQTI